MSSDQQRGTKAADNAHNQGKNIDYNKMTPGERDAAAARDKQNKSGK